MSLTKIRKQDHFFFQSTYSNFVQLQVINELVHKSILSGAKFVEIEVDSTTCGLNYLKVQHNGEGVLMQDRDGYFSSVCDDPVDLVSIRGRGLSFPLSLSKVDLLEIKTKHSGDIQGECWRLDETGSRTREKPEILPNGTTVSVRGLKNCLPPKYKFCRVSQETLRSTVLRYCMVHNSTGFLLKFNSPITNIPKQKVVFMPDVSRCPLIYDTLYRGKLSLNNIKEFNVKSSSLDIHVILPDVDRDDCKGTKIPEFHCLVVNDLIFATNCTWISQLNDHIKTTYAEVSPIKNVPFWCVCISGVQDIQSGKWMKQVCKLLDTCIAKVCNKRLIVREFRVPEKPTYNVPPSNDTPQKLPFFKEESVFSCVSDFDLPVAPENTTLPTEPNSPTRYPCSQDSWEFSMFDQTSDICFDDLPPPIAANYIR